MHSQWRSYLWIQRLLVWQYMGCGWQLLSIMGNMCDFFLASKKYIYIYIYIYTHIFLLYLYIGWWNFPSHGLRNWGNLSFYSFPSALSDGHLMTMSCLGTTNWFGLAGCPADTSAWRTLPDGGLEVSGINQGFAGVWFPITPWFMLCGNLSLVGRTYT